VRLMVAGSAEGHAADVYLDLASPLTTVTLGCFDTAPESRTTVRFPRASGGTSALSEVVLQGARLGELRLGTRRVGLDTTDPHKCELTLGTDVLAPYAVRLDPLTREVRLDRSRARADYLAQVGESGEKSPDEVHLVDLSRDPTADWPVVTLRLKQSRAELVGPFVLSTREPHSVVSDAAAHRAGLVPGPDLLKELSVADGVAVPSTLLAPGYPLDALELAPGFGLRWDAVASDPKWSNAGAVGVMGSDVWGRFVSTIDIRAGVLLLRRPRVFASGDKQRCATPSGPTEEACFQLNSSQTPGQPVDVVGVVWRDLPEGARVYLEPQAANGSPLQLSCRVGFTFDKADRGASTQHLLPWEGLQKSLPSCAEDLHKVASYRLELIEEGGLNDCPGECAFVQELLTNRVTCECAPQLWGGGTESEQRFLRMYRQLLEKVRGHAPNAPKEDPEPED
jgi:hypothetical protein